MSYTHKDQFNVPFHYPLPQFVIMATVEEIAAIQQEVSEYFTSAYDLRFVRNIGQGSHGVRIYSMTNMAMAKILSLCYIGLHYYAIISVSCITHCLFFKHVTLL